MKKYHAHFEAVASTTVDFGFDPGDLTEDELTEALENAAYEAFQGAFLCHQCARGLDLGDFELIANFAIEEA